MQFEASEELGKDTDSMKMLSSQIEYKLQYTLEIVPANYIGMRSRRPHMMLGVYIVC
jgi:hypothetical protein